MGFINQRNHRDNQVYNMYERNKIVKYFHAYFSQLETNYIFLRAVARNLRQNKQPSKTPFFHSLRNVYVFIWSRASG